MSFINYFLIRRRYIKFKCLIWNLLWVLLRHKVLYEGFTVLFITDGSANEECSDVGLDIVARKIIDCQTRIFRSVDYSRKLMLLFFSRFSALKSDLEWLLQQKTYWKTKKYHCYQIIKFKIHLKSNNKCDSKCELRSVFKIYLRN